VLTFKQYIHGARAETYVYPAMDAKCRTGILGKREPPVFAEVADRLRERGYGVQFFKPRADLAAASVNDLSLVVNKQVFPHNLAALRDARRMGTPLWNNLTATVLFASRLNGLAALEAVGFRTPEVTFEKPDGEYVAKDDSIWGGDPELNGEGEFYQELVQTWPVDYKYYAVDDGSRIHVAGRCVTSKLYGPKRFLCRAQDHPPIASRLRHLVDRFDLRGVGVDFVRDPNGQFWAIDVNLAAGYRNTGLESALCNSIRTSISSR
jgi:hypothetical protein